MLTHFYLVIIKRWLHMLCNNQSQTVLLQDLTICCVCVQHKWPWILLSTFAFHKINSIISSSDFLFWEPNQMAPTFGWTRGKINNASQEYLQRWSTQTVAVEKKCGEESPLVLLNTIFPNNPETLASDLHKNYGSRHLFVWTSGLNLPNIILNYSCHSGKLLT